jgi:hypothetical protein
LFDPRASTAGIRERYLELGPWAYFRNRIGQMTHAEKVLGCGN